MAIIQIIDMKTIPAPPDMGVIIFHLNIWIIDESKTPPKEVYAKMKELGWIINWDESKTSDGRPSDSKDVY